VLTGGAGKDQFIFDTKLGKTNVDAITDFEAGNDRIVLNHGVFTKLETGDLSASAFAIGSKPADGADRIIYNDKTGALYYDADGSGQAKPVLFAELDAHLTLSASDFLVI
jgi:cysteinyl-tRNA synthetase